MGVAVSFPCARCGQFPNPAVVNRTVLVQTPAGRSPLQMLPRHQPSVQPDEYIPLTDLCLRCTFDQELATAWHILDAIGASSKRRGVWMIDCMPGYELGDEWADFSTLTFGRQVGLVAAPADAHPFDTARVVWAAHYRPTAGLIFVTQSWLRRVRYRDTSLYLEERWNPTLSALVADLRGLNPDVPDSVAHEALRGRRLLQLLSGRGRPSGGRFDSPEECRDAVFSVMEEKLEARQRFNQQDIEFFLFGVESGGRQLRRALAPYRWSDILDEARKANP